MNEHDQYRQGALDLTPPEISAPTEAMPSTEASPADRIDRDPAILPSRRLPDDFWPEFVAEWRFREEHGMEAVGPAEFADLRDWSDGVTWPIPIEERGGAYGPSAGYDDEPLPDAPRRDRFGRAGETVFDARKAKLDATIDVLAKKVEEIVTGDGYRAYLTMVGRFHTYSANNVALILAQYPDATRVMGYGNKAGTTGWKSMGRFVREGEKGIRIIRPMHRTIRDEEDTTAEPVKVLTGFTTATVFDVTQTEGRPLPHEPRPAELTPDETMRSLELKVKLLRIIDEAGARVVRDHESTQRGSWNPAKREIGVRADLSGIQELKTLVHETAHLLADHRRDGVAMQDAETVAESVAFVVLDHHGIDTSAYSVPYIAGWARDPAVVSRNLDAVRTLSHALLTAFGDDCPPEDEGDAAREWAR
jgi:hypothetical protein